MGKIAADHRVARAVTAYQFLNVVVHDHAGKERDQQEHRD
jgi:hypothetical protein